MAKRINVGKSNGSYKHGLADKHPLYSKWHGIKRRCYGVNTSNYKYYGANGVTVYNEWINDFKAFYDWCIANGWKEGYEISRIGDTGNYEPGNVRFVTAEENHKELIKKQYKQIICIEQSITFNSLQDAGKWVMDQNLSKGIIKTVIFNIKRVSKTGGTAYGFHWKMMGGDYSNEINR